MAAHDTVQVAVRVRPLNEAEISKGGNICLDVYKREKQVLVKATNQGFTFNYVFGCDSGQQEIYDVAVSDLLKQLFKGYNVTILAYGQTGSGKTFTMGTSYVPGGSYPKGIIPLAIEEIFKKINSDSEWEYNVTASFIELYMEQLYDLLSDRPRENSMLDIREDTRGVCIPNLTEKPVTSTKEAFCYLQHGSTCRATGATAMNAQSSRSHAIFTISLNFNKKDNIDDAMTAKFHLVDLAGSERSKKTQTSGDRFKEGININKGLLVLGNVISALGEGHNGHISYRDSKLTRLLQDSLGGNSQTLMIACISPSDFNQDETISTLRYADRARRIKNRPIINQDPKVAENAKLKREIEQLNRELLSLRAQCELINGKQMGDGDNVSTTKCPPEHQYLVEENENLNGKIKVIMNKLYEALQDNYNLIERAEIAEQARDRISKKLVELDVEYSHTLESFNNSDSCLIEPLQELQKKLKELKEEQKKGEEEILSHEMYADSAGETGVREQPDGNGNSDYCPGTPKEEERMKEKHVFQQAELSKELQMLTKNLAYKEELVKKLAASCGIMTDTKNDSEDQMKTLQNQLSDLQRERDELSEQIRNMQQNKVGNKLAEQRRKKLQELEQKIALLNKKVTEQARVIKMKEKSDEKIVNLKKEILSMKQSKVRLIQQMKSESERFRLLRLTRERELCKLREQDRKRQNQMLRMEMLHNKQQNVLKRKVEEVAAVNKRLKDALAVKNAAQERLGFTNKIERVTSLLDQELEVLVSTAEAERTIDLLKKDRNCLNEELRRLKTLTTDNMSEEELKKVESEKESLLEDIELRSTQIADMQQKIMDSNQESKWRNHVEQLHSLMDAKSAIKHLFTLATDAKKDASIKEFMLKETKEMCSELKEKLNNYEKVLSDLKEQNTRELMKLEKENQDKVYLLLNQLAGKDELCNSNDSDQQLRERIKIQNEELEKMDQLRQEVAMLREANDKLQKELEEAEKKHSKQKVIKASNKENVPKSPKVVLKNALDEDEDTPCDDDDYDDNKLDDPDWRNTPIFKRLQALKSVNRHPSVPVKRGSDGVPKCCCKSGCAKKTCGCRKAGSMCSDRCRCNRQSCQNYDSNISHVAGDESADSYESSDSDSFKKPRALSPNNILNATRIIHYDD